MAPKWYVPLAALLVAAALAPALVQADSDEDARIHLIAHPIEDDAAAKRPLNASLGELKVDAPPVARAVQNPGEIIDVSQEEYEALKDFWDRMSDHDALRVEEDLFELQLVMESDGGTGGSSTSKQVDESTPSSDGAEQAQGTYYLVATLRDEPALRPLNMTMEDLEAEYPVVARAVRAPDMEVAVAEDEEENARAFWDRMSGHDALRVGDALFAFQMKLYGEATASDGAEATKAVNEDVPADGEQADAQGDARTVPAFGALGAVVAAAAATLRRR